MGFEGAESCALSAGEGRAGMLRGSGGGRDGAPLLDVATNAGSFGAGGCAGAGADHKDVGAGTEEGDGDEGPDPERVAGWGAGGGGAAAGDKAGGR